MPSSQSLPPDLLSAAAALVVQERRACPDLLQRTFSLDGAAAQLLLAQLAGSGVVEEPNPAGRFHVALDRLPVSVTRQPDAVVHVRVLRDLALYLLENHGYESTDCVDVLADPFACDRAVLRPVVARVLESRPDNLLEATVLALGALPQMSSRIPIDGLHPAVAAACAGLTIPVRQTSDKAAARLGGLLHAMRYLQRRVMQDIDPNSRVVDIFIHRSLLPHGRARDIAKTHEEHVVPCAFIARKAMELLRHGIPAGEAAAWIEPYVRIVTIDESKSDLLDGKLGLRDCMPKWWLWGRDCMYARLHHVDVAFKPPIEGPGCGCGRADVLPTGS
jgi:hypothetical protein